MKKLLLVSLMLLIVSSSKTFAEEAFQKNYGISYSSTRQLDFRKFINESLMVYAGISYGASEYKISGLSSNATVFNGYSIDIGVRKYVSNNNLSDFVDFLIMKSYSKINSDSGGVGNVQNTQLYLAYGLEYMISPVLSIEGKTGVLYQQSNQTDNTLTYTSSGYVLPYSAIALNYYWK